MPVAPWLDALAGFLLVSVVLSDVFRTVVLPRATQRTLRLGPQLGRFILWGARSWAQRRPKSRHRVLGVLGPLLMVTEMLVWVLLLIAGYALLLHATGGLKPSNSYGDALYAAAAVFVTLGLSGQEAASGPARTVVAVAGLSGLAVVTLVVTFLLSVQAALLRREAQVLRLRARVGARPSGVLLLETLARLGPATNRALPDFFTEWEGWAADVLLSHRAFPILVHFRSTDEDCGWMAALGAVLDASALVEAMEHQDAGEHAAVCHRMAVRLVTDLARQFGVSAHYQPGLDRPAFDDGMRRLDAAGYVPHADRERMWTTFVQLRAGHNPPLQALSKLFGEPEARW